MTRRGLVVFMLGVVVGMYLANILWFLPLNRTLTTDRPLGELERQPRVPQIIRCQWQNHPDELLYPVDNWYCIVGENVRGTARRYERDPVYNAFIGGAFCGTGEFTTLNAAKKCVEEHTSR